MKPECSGEGWDGDHCCFVRGKECPYLERDVAGRRFACGLLLKYGSWEKANGSPEYRLIGEQWQSGDLPFNYCQTFSPAFCCRPEFRAGFANERQAREAGYLNDDGSVNL